MVGLSTNLLIRGNNLKIAFDITNWTISKRNK